MKFVKTKLEGLFIVECAKHTDHRGVFVKTLHQETFEKQNLPNDFCESYYSISNKDTIRGMHFQTPPYHHEKLVYVPQGKILDVILDIRKASPTYGQYEMVELSAKNARMVYIPKGLAHGFVTQEDNTNVTYLQTTMYAPKNDKGIRYDSFGFPWEIKTPILSDRDKNFPKFQDYQSPF
jgi:dTDP-4-dehydrorhamnose 3,5-epimerase/CDP-3, 6-dideoxy-D-glycero-D-glycero-4-hexulose-5-epimerase